MRKIFLILLFISGSMVFTYAQSDLEIFQNKISVNMVSLLSRQILQQANYYPAFMHGLMYTRNLSGNNAVRIKFNYFQHTTENSEGDFADRNLWSDIEMGAGYVQFLGYGHVVKPYVSTDIVITSTLIFSEYGGTEFGSYEKQQLRRTGVSIEPALGVAFQVSQILSFAIETNLEIGGSYEKGTDYTWSAVTVPLEEPVRQLIFIHRWNPFPLFSFELSF